MLFLVFLNTFGEKNKYSLVTPGMLFSIQNIVSGYFVFVLIKDNLPSNLVQALVFRKSHLRKYVSPPALF